MALSHEDFVNLWNQAGQPSNPEILDTAWKRYQTTQEPNYTTTPESSDPSTTSFLESWQPFLSDPAILPSISEARFLTLNANAIPFTPTAVQAKPNQQISTFATGRVWVSRPLDLYIRPQWALWFKVGNNGTVFNATEDTNTFTPSEPGEVYIANQFPGQFADPTGGRLIGPLGAHEGIEGRFEVLFIVWNENVDVRALLSAHANASTPGITQSLLSTELARLTTPPELPTDWSYLWFLGTSKIYKPLPLPPTSTTTSPQKPCIHARPTSNVGILQRALTPAVPLTPTTTVSWSWLVASIPSSLREDTPFTHDYLSLAFEFSNGRDITYTWSDALDRDYGYWCPLPNWQDREYHVVIRSGKEGLGEWLAESRGLWADYVKYINAGDEGKAVPRQVVKVWLIAGNMLQRGQGEMTVSEIRIEDGEETRSVL